MSSRRWTVSLQGAITFLQQRLEHDAQVEIQEYAKAVKDLTKDAFPQVYSAAFPLSRIKLNDN